METVPMTIINLDSEDGEDMPTSTSSTTNSIDKSQNSNGSSSFVSSQMQVSELKVVKVGRPKKTASKKIIRTVPVKILPKPTQLAYLNKLNTVTPGTSSSNNDTTESMKVQEKLGPKSKNQLYLISPIPNDPKNPITKIMLLEPNSAIETPPPLLKLKGGEVLKKSVIGKPSNQQHIQMVQNNTQVETRKTGGEVLKKSVIAKPSNQQHIQMVHNNTQVQARKTGGEVLKKSESGKPSNQQHMQMLHNNVQARRAKPNIIRQQRVYVKEMKELRDSTDKETNRINTDLKNTPFSTTSNVTDEQDPLYIPGMQLRESLTSATVSQYPNDPYRRAITPNPTRRKPQRRPSHSPAPQQDPLSIPASELEQKMSLSLSSITNSKDSAKPRNKSTRATTPKPRKITERRKSRNSVYMNDPPYYANRKLSPYYANRKLPENVPSNSEFRDAIVSLPAHSRPKRPASALRKTPTPNYKESESDENLDDMDIFTPIVTLTEPANSEHSVVTNYSLLNKVATNKETLRVRSQSVPPKLIKNNKVIDSNPVFQKIHLKDVSPKSAKKDRVVNSDLVYRKIILTDVLKSDNCRNFFIKNSAWDYLEPVFKGFNEREKNISESCSKYFSRLLNNIGEKRQKETDRKYLTNDELFYTRKIEVLDKEGKLDKVYYVPPENQVSRKGRARSVHRFPETKKCETYYDHPKNQVTRKRRASSVYRLPETKKCKVVLQREEYVENLLKKYLMRESLDSLLSEHLSIPKGDSHKPLIILNRVNFNVLKVNEILCKHANIIYVKRAEEGFPDKLYKNDFLVSQMEKKVIRMVTPNALKYYFQ